MRMLTSLFLVLVLGISLLPARAANETVPLQLTVSADTAVLLATPRQLRRATENTPRYDVETTKLTLTFTNTGTTALKLNCYDLVISRLHISVTGPDAGSVVTWQREMKRSMREMQTGDIQVLQPGASYTAPYQMAFSGSIGASEVFLQRPGLYQFRITYNNLSGIPGAFTGALAKDCWQGLSASNTLTFKMLEAGEAQQGLQIALDSTPAAAPDDPAFTLTGYVKNAGAEPVVIRAWNLFYGGLNLIGDDGKEIPFTGGADRSREAKPDELFATLKPGEKKGFPINGNYYSDDAKDDTPHGSFGVMDNTGFFRTWHVTGGSVIAQAVLEMGSERDNLPASVPTEHRWQGRVVSPRTVIPLNLTAHRKALLTKSLADFTLNLHYNGDQEKPFYALLLSTKPVPQLASDPFSPNIVITEQDAAALIGYLAKAGILRDAQSMEVAASVRQDNTTGYLMNIRGKITGAYWKYPLGWDLALCRKLDAFGAQVPEKARPAMVSLQGRLSGLRGWWEAEDALQQPRTVHLADGTLQQAIAIVGAAANCPSLRVQLDGSVKAQPIAAVDYRDIPTGEIFRSLAALAGAKCTMEHNVVRIQP